MSWDYFAVMVIVTLPAAIAYPLVYGFRTRWWRDWIGRALLIKATAVGILIGITAAYQVFGPDYWGRNVFRNAGITLLAVGVWLALIAMLREFHKKSSTRENR